MFEQKIIEMYKKNISLRKISEELKISRCKINSILFKNNLRSYEILEKHKVFFNKENSDSYIKEKTGLSLKQITLIKKQMGIEKYTFKTHKENENFFEVIDTEEKAYWLGFLYGDGHIDNTRKNVISLELKESDIEHLKKFTKALESDAKISYRKKTKSYRTEIYNKKLTEDIIKLGCFENKSFKIRFPYFIKNKDFLRVFIRGYFEADGGLSINFMTTRHRIKTYFVGNLDFLNQLKDYLIEIGVLKNDSLGIYQKKGAKIYSLAINRKKCSLNLLKYLYYNSSENTRLNRKFEKFLIIKDEDCRPQASPKKVGGLLKGN